MLIVLLLALSFGSPAMVFPWWIWVVVVLWDVGNGVIGHYWARQQRQVQGYNGSFLGSSWPRGG